MWAQPWAWLGLAGLAVPIAIHLLARHQAVRAAFPTLRFIDASELNAIKRQRLTDIPLLLVRLLMVALAVAAIAGPRIGSTPAEADERVATAYVHDMSASSSFDAQSDLGVDDARTVGLGSESIPAALEAAAAWAVRKPGARKIVVISDFQRGSLSEAGVRRVPSGIGIEFKRVGSKPASLPTGLSLAGDKTRMAWGIQGSAALKAIRVVAGADQSDADAMLAAVDRVTPIPEAGAPQVLVLFSKAPERQLLATAEPIDQQWMFDFTKELLSKRPDVKVRATGTRPRQLLVALDDAPGSLAAAEAVASLAAVYSPATPESDPRTIDDATLKSWERPAEAAVVEAKGEPQGRWLWMGVLALLAIETGMRRRAA